MSSLVSLRRASLGAALLLVLGHAPARAGEARLDGLASDTAFDQFIVQYRPGSATAASGAAIDRGLARAAQAVAPDARGVALGAQRVRRLGIGADVVRTSRALGRVEAALLMRRLAADADVAFVEVDGRLWPAMTPNDPLYASQWHYAGLPAGIRTPNAWNLTAGVGVTVAVIDTGVAPHSDLNANIVPGYDFISDPVNARDGNGRDANPNDEGDGTTFGSPCYALSPRNSSWHGTHVAGLIAARTGNALGVAGTAFGARVQPLRVSGPCGATISDIADAITWGSGGTVAGIPANATPSRVINLSLSAAGTCSIALQTALNGASARGSLVIVPAGNANAAITGYQPANCTGVMVVAAVTNTGARASFSNSGAGVALAAPGVGILSTLNSGTLNQGAENYASYNGTSSAAPLVAGVAALVQGRRIALAQPPFTGSQLATHLRTHVTAFPVTPDKPIGTGIVNAEDAVNTAVPLVLAPAGTR